MINLNLYKIIVIILSSYILFLALLFLLLQKMFLETQASFKCKKYYN